MDGRSDNTPTAWATAMTEPVTSTPRTDAEGGLGALGNTAASPEHDGDAAVLRLAHPLGTVEIRTLSPGKRRVKVRLFDASLFMPIDSCDTSYPVDLIGVVLHAKGPQYLCDEILRDEDPRYVSRMLERDLLAYLDPGWFTGKRILDFGCGAGASTFAIARLFPDSEIVGVELRPWLMALAEQRRNFYRFSRVALKLSPSGLEIPSEIGMFDLVVMSAVYEHLLAEERRAILPRLWSTIRPGGYLFLNQTPHRYFPIEMHTTGLPLLNYLPDYLAYRIARAWSVRVRKTDTWEELLREGIRGATEQEILGLLQGHDGTRPTLLVPGRGSLGNRIDHWHKGLGQARHRTAKRLLRLILVAIKRLTGITLVPELALLIRKDRVAQCERVA